MNANYDVCMVCLVYVHVCAYVCKICMICVHISMYGICICAGVCVLCVYGSVYMCMCIWPPCASNSLIFLLFSCYLSVSTKTGSGSVIQ